MCACQLCGTTPCMVCGSEQIKQTIEKHLGIHEGETTADGMFTLREVLYVCMYVCRRELTRCIFMYVCNTRCL